MSYHVKPTPQTPAEYCVLVQRRPEGLDPDVLSTDLTKGQESTMMPISTQTETNTMSLTFEAPAAQAIGRLVSVEAVEPAVTDSPVHGDEISDQVRLGFVNVTSEVVADADPYVAIDANRDTVDGVRVDTRVFLRAARRRFDYPDATVLSPVRRARSGEIAARLKLLER